MMDLFTAADVRDEAIARGAANATPSWNDLMFSLVERVCRRHRVFNADDPFDLYDALESPPVTHDTRAFGAVMVRAAKAGFCRKTNVTRNSRRSSCHLRPLAMWESLIAE